VRRYARDPGQEVADTGLAEAVLTDKVAVGFGHESDICAFNVGTAVKLRRDRDGRSGFFEEWPAGRLTAEKIQAGVGQRTRELSPPGATLVGFGG
jgi:hypothetical protein